MTAISVIGLGAMGSRLASRLVQAGHDVTVWNRSAAAAESLAAQIPVRVASTARGAVAEAQVVITMVADDAASESIWLHEDLGVLAAMPAAAIAIEASTVTRSHVLRLGEHARAAEVAFLEAPVVGSRPQADAGALVVLVGGADVVIDRVEPIFDAFAGAIRRVGALGNAASLKLAINGLFAMQVAAYAETVGALERAGFEVDDVAELLAALPITSPGLQRIVGLFPERNFAPNFPVGLVAKDLRYLATLAGDVDAEMPMSAAAARVFDAAIDEGHGALDIAGVAARYLGYPSN